jgi:tetratricopeptide (TPR) repeat protein
VRRSALPLLACLLLALAAFTLGYVGNEDFGWYLASGDEILARGGIPDRDPFLYTSSRQDTWVTSGAQQRTWVTHSWGWTVVLAALRRGFGLEGIAVFSTISAALLTALVYTRARLDRFGLANAALTSLALAASLDRFTPRTDLASALLLVAFLVLLDTARPLRWPRVAALCALQALWANLHGGFPLGVGVAAAYALGDRSARDGAPRLALVPLLCAASLLPPGLGVERVAGALAFARELLATGAGREASPIAEWQPTYAAGLTAPALFHLAWTALGAASFAATRPPIRLARAVAFAGLALLGAAATRFVSLFALAAALVTLANLATLRAPLAAWLARPRPAALRALHAGSAALACALLLATAAALWISRAALDGRSPRAGFTALRPEFTAPGAAAFIRAQRLPGPIFNDIALGGDLIDALHPDFALFVDTRNLSARVLAAYRQAVARPQAWSALAQREGFRTVVLSNLSFASPPLRKQLAQDPAWRLAFLDPQASVFVRAEHASDARIEPMGRWGDAVPFVPRGGPGPQGWIQRYGRALLLSYLRALADLGQLAPLDQVATRALARLPGDGAVHAFRGYARLRQGRALEASEDYAAAVEADPGDVTARIGLVRALLRGGRADEARPQLDALDALAPGNAAAQRLRARLSGEATRRSAP